MTIPKPLILASSSPYRRAQLAQLQLHFEAIAPNIDEQANTGETAEQLVARLAKAKAYTVCDTIDKTGARAIVIGSDQSATIDGHFLCKPHTREAAVAQLLQSQGKTVTFYTGLHLTNLSDGMEFSSVTATTVIFRRLSKQQIESYVDREPALDCAGGFKCEGLGTSLFEAIHSDDPSALVGLPLIKLCEGLLYLGHDVLTD